MRCRPGDQWRCDHARPILPVRSFVLFHRASSPIIDWAFIDSYGKCKIRAFKEQATKMLFVEEICDGVAGNHNHGGPLYHQKQGLE
jgi:hypothetical protein